MANNIPPLAMSQTKEDLLKHLNLHPETYALMAKETDQAYTWLTSTGEHLKANCKRKPPYDWSDIAEKSKDEAIRYMARSGDAHTSYYWNLARPTEDCPNWIAKWFLYHKFRYRDGRNRSANKNHSSSSASARRERSPKNPVFTASPSASPQSQSYFDSPLRPGSAAPRMDSTPYYDPVRDV